MSWQDAEERAVEQVRQLFRQTRTAVEQSTSDVNVISRLEDVMLTDGHALLRRLAQAALDEQVHEVEKKRGVAARRVQKSAGTKGRPRG